MYKQTSNIVCKILGHKWGWCLANTENTVIGTQWCIRCKRVFRGVYVDKRKNNNPNWKG